MAAVVVVVTEVVEDHHDYHKDGVADGQDVKRSSADVFGLKIQINKICRLHVRILTLT